jgi:hypothetical protein
VVPRPLRPFAPRLSFTTDLNPRNVTRIPIQRLGNYRLSNLESAVRGFSWGPQRLALHVASSASAAWPCARQDAVFLQPTVTAVGLLLIITPRDVVLAPHVLNTRV